MAIRLIVGLGNPGSRYERTRHNLGFMAADAYVARHHDRFRRSRFGPVAEVNRVFVLKPQTYMNLSGEAVGPFCRFYRLDPAEIVVLVDDLDLPLGTIRLRASGSSGGHNGLKSIAQALGTEEFPRLRMGISRPPESISVIDWVLMRFSPSEQPLLAQVIDRAVDTLTTLVTDGIENAMSRHNG